MGAVACLPISSAGTSATAKNTKRERGFRISFAFFAVNPFCDLRQVARHVPAPSPREPVSLKPWGNLTRRRGDAEREHAPLTPMCFRGNAARRAKKPYRHCGARYLFGTIRPNLMS